MNPKEKAKEIYDKFTNLLGEEMPALRHREEFKKCVIICIKEVLNSSPSLPILGDKGTFGEDIELSTKYWQETLEKLNELDELKNL